VSIFEELKKADGPKQFVRKPYQRKGKMVVERKPRTSKGKASKEPLYQSLAYYEARAKKMSEAELSYAIKDVKSAMKAKETHSAGSDVEAAMKDPYMKKLYAEYDAYTVELHKRQKPLGQKASKEGMGPIKKALQKSKGTRRAHIRRGKTGVSQVKQAIIKQKKVTKAESQQSK